MYAADTLLAFAAYTIYNVSYVIGKVFQNRFVQW